MAQQKLFEIDPHKLPRNVRLLKEYQHPLFHGRVQRIFLAGKDLVVLQGEAIYPDGDVVRGQLELPVPAIGWLIDSIEKRFWVKPSEGGLARDILHDEAAIEGERILINRGSSVGGEGVGGFLISNLDRTGYGAWPRAQDCDLLDIELLDVGVLDFFKQLVAQYVAGSL